jgi:hypothetical protein
MSAARITCIYSRSRTEWVVSQTPGFVVRPRAAPGADSYDTVYAPVVEAVDRERLGRPLPPFVSDAAGAATIGA